MFGTIAAMALLVERGIYRWAGIALGRRGTAAARQCQLDVRLSVDSYRFISGRRGGGGRRWARVQGPFADTTVPVYNFTQDRLVRGVSAADRPRLGRALAGNLTQYASSARAVCILQRNNDALHGNIQRTLNSMLYKVYSHCK